MNVATSAQRASFARVDDTIVRPRWSVMVPTFNCAQHLESALRSVLAQDIGPEDMQIEVVDDASDRDDPKTVVRDVGEGRVTFHRQERNVGHIENFDTCIRRSKGSFVHLLHGDDEVLPGFYEALGRGLDSDASIGLAFSGWRIIDAVSSTLSVCVPLQKNAGLLKDAVVTLAQEQRVVTPSMVVRRSSYEFMGGFDRRLVCAEDWEMWVRLASRFAVWYEPAVLASYRTHADSNTGRHHRLAEELEYTRMAIRLFQPYLPPERAATIVRAACRAYAATALRNARDFAVSGDAEAVRAHLRASLRFSPRPRVIAAATKILLDAGRAQT